ncbi:MAG: PilN domain-containing protein [Desulfobacterales bacterium]|nr:PilN domain-containing protein [Desulfobacterales bacterium]
MIKINLLPYKKARVQDNIREQMLMLVITAVITLAICIFVHVKLTNQIDELNQNIKVATAEKEKYEAQAKQLDEIKQKLEILAKKIQVMDDLELGKREAVLLLDMMTQTVIPKRMYFTGFDFVGGVVNIDGSALDNKTVADFMTKLERTGLFSSVELKSITQCKVKESAEVKCFSIKCVKAPLKKPDNKANKGEG